MTNALHFRKKEKNRKKKKQKWKVIPKLSCENSCIHYVSNKLSVFMHHFVSDDC